MFAVLTLASKVTYKYISGIPASVYPTTCACSALDCVSSITNWAASMDHSSPFFLCKWREKPREKPSNVSQKYEHVQCVDRLFVKYYVNQVKYATESSKSALTFWFNIG